MECEYSVYDPKTKTTENHTYIATIPLKDFYNRRLRNMKSCIVSFKTKETSLVIDNYEVVKYCSWEEGLDYFNNKRADMVINMIKKHKVNIIYTAVILLLIVGIVMSGTYINNKYEPLDKFKSYINDVKTEQNAKNYLYEQTKSNIIGEWISQGTKLTFSEQGNVLIKMDSYSLITPYTVKNDGTVLFNFTLDELAGDDIRAAYAFLGMRYEPSEKLRQRIYMVCRLDNDALFMQDSDKFYNAEKFIKKGSEQKQVSVNNKLYNIGDSKTVTRGTLDNDTYYKFKATGYDGYIGYYYINGAGFIYTENGNSDDSYAIRLKTPDHFTHEYTKNGTVITISLSVDDKFYSQDIENAYYNGYKFNWNHYFKKFK